MLEKLKKWARERNGQECDPDVLGDVKTALIDGIYYRSQKDLDQIRLQLSPVSSELLRRLEKKGVAFADLQSAEVAVIDEIARAALFLMERDDPETSLAQIRHGKMVLDILTADPNASLSNQDILKRWPSDLDKPSNSTISRTLAALEDAGFVLRQGSTRGRKCLLTPKAEAWRQRQRNCAGNDSGLPVENRLSTICDHTRPEPPSNVIPFENIKNRRSGKVGDGTDDFKKYLEQEEAS